MAYQTFTVSNEDLARALVGRLADMVVEDLGEVRVRIVKASTYASEVQVVDPNTKE